MQNLMENKIWHLKTKIYYITNAKFVIHSFRATFQMIWKICLQQTYSYLLNHLSGITSLQPHLQSQHIHMNISNILLFEV